MHVFPDHEALSLAAAAHIADTVRQAVRERGRALLCLCGGSTPPRAYDLVSQADLPWEHLHVFWGDERWQGESGNHFETTASLFAGAHLHPFSLEPATAVESSIHYEEHLRHFFGGELPRFDLAVQGLGDDGHTASLFPGTLGLQEEFRWVVAHPVPSKGGKWRLSLTYPVLQNCQELLFLVSGAGKREALAAVRAGADLPATRLVQGKNATVFADAAAAPTT